MLEEKDLQKIAEIVAASEERMIARMDSSITASEERMIARMDSSITASEERMKSYVDNSVTASEERMIARMDAMENRWMAFYESKIQPQFQLLAEGQQTLLETLAPKNRVEALEDEVVFLKSVIKSLAQDVAELKQSR